MISLFLFCYSWTLFGVPRANASKVSQTNSHSQDMELTKIAIDDTITLYLYESHSDVDKKNGKEHFRHNEKGEITHISSVTQPRLQVYRPKKPTGTMVLICPGGGYTNLNIGKPRILANQLTKYGVTVFVLIYRLPLNHHVPAPKEFKALADVRAAVKLINKKAIEWQYPSTKIVLWGSSAGAHLAAMAATATSYQQSDTLNRVKPDYLVLTFPLLSFRRDVAKKYWPIRELVLGENPSEQDVHQFSPIELVTAETPKTFLVHANDDPLISPLNSLLFYQALHRANVDAELHIYNRGGHGFGYRSDEKNSWMNRLIEWFDNYGLL